MCVQPRRPEDDAILSRGAAAGNERDRNYRNQ